MKGVLFWHRRDLRLDDNQGLRKAIDSGAPIYPLFIFDSNILDELEENDQRVIFIHQEINRLRQEYKDLGGHLHVHVGDPIKIIPKLAKELDVSIVYTNKDYEPYAKKRDSNIADLLSKIGAELITCKDHVIFEEAEVVKNDGEPYTVFTPYSKKWKEAWKSNIPQMANAPDSSVEFIKRETSFPSLQDLGFKDEHVHGFPDRNIDLQVIDNYEDTRDIPSKRGTTRLSLHLRFGTISIRKLAQEAWEHNEKYLNELIWRDFYQMIIHHFPESATENFRRKYDGVEWINDEKQFDLWCKGETGYPIVDAGMRELNETGFMHNRVRMIVASFLCKHLLIDWRWGEAYFAKKLLDYELASNVGGWQWAAGSGCDAAPYFRVFNPTLQQEKFDPKGVYIRQWVKNFDSLDYPTPIVEHKMARQRAIDTYKKGLN